MIGDTELRLKIMVIASICHEANRAYCVSIGDLSQPAWDEAPEWQTESAMNGVIFHIANPNAGPEASHENWRIEKLKGGWVWGPVKNEEKKQHPCMTSYQDLPFEQRFKDSLFIGIVKTCTTDGQA